MHTTTYTIRGEWEQYSVLCTLTIRACRLALPSPMPPLRALCEIQMHDTFKLVGESSEFEVDGGERGRASKERREVNAREGMTRSKWTRRSKRVGCSDVDAASCN